MKASQLRIELLTILASSEEPITTTDARLAIARILDTHNWPVTSEQVYRAFSEIPGPVRGYRQQPGKGGAQ